MAYTYLDPTAAGDATGINVDGECYQYVGTSTLSPSVASIQGTSDGCPCNTSWACTNCLGQCFAQAATVTLTWSFDVPENLLGTGACLDSFNEIASGSVTVPYSNYSPVQFPANIPAWANVFVDVDDPPVLIQVSYNCSNDTWSFTIGDNSQPFIPPRYPQQGINRPGGYTPPQNVAISGNSCGADDDGENETVSGSENAGTSQ